LIDAHKVLICSASSDRVNSNAILREYVGRGFAELLPEENVMTCSLDFSVEATKYFNPDIIVVFGSCMPSSCDYTALRSYCSRTSALLAFWLHDDPYEFDFNNKVYQYADFIFSNDKWAAVHIDRPNVFHLPLAADPGTHFRPILSDMDRDVFFCGVSFPNRLQLLADCEGALSSFRVEVFGEGWPENPSFYRNMRIQNSLLSDYYASSLLTLNIGRRFNLANDKYQLDATTPGPRTFEAAMAGSVQCVYLEGLELSDYFIFGEEILVFESPEELKTIVSRLSEDLGWRAKIAMQSQLRALKDHTYKNRAETLLNLIF
jgi:spore maturation protein CgeB